MKGKTMSIRRVYIPSVEEITLNAVSTRTLEDLLIRIGRQMYSQRDELRDGSTDRIVVEVNLAANDRVVLAAASVIRREGWTVIISEETEKTEFILLPLREAYSIWGDTVYQ